MTLAVHHRTAAAHGQTHDGALSLTAPTVVLPLHGREEFVEEPVLERPAGHIEIAVLVVMDVRVSGIGHYDDDRQEFTGGDEFIGYILHAAQLLPGLIIVGKAVQEIDHGVMAVYGISLRQIHVAVLLCLQVLAI